MMVYLYLVRDQWPPEDPFWAGDFFDPVENGNHEDENYELRQYQLIKIVFQCQH